MTHIFLPINKGNPKRNKNQQFDATRYLFVPCTINTRASTIEFYFPICSYHFINL